MSSVLDAPKSRDYFTLDSETSPGLCVILSGGNRQIEIQDQGQPLTQGANTVVRMRKNIVVTYGFKLWLPGHFTTRDRWQKMLDEGSKRIPPRVYTIRDLRIPSLLRVIYEGESPEKVEKPGGPWAWEVTLHEYNRVKLYGGAVKPPDALDKAVTEANEEAKAAKAAFDQARAAAAAAAKAGK